MNPAHNPRRAHVRSRRVHDERGGSLVLALFAITGVSLLVMSISSLAQSTMQSAIAVRNQGVRTFGADGAIDTAIAAMRGTVSDGRYGSACSTMTIALSDGTSANVACTPQTGSGAPIGGGGSNSPDQAILTTGTVASGEAGITINGNKSVVGTNGSVLDNSSIVFQKSDSTLTAGGYFTASGSCTAAQITSNPAPACNLNSNGPLVTAALAKFPNPITAAPPTVTPPTCPGSNKYVALSPGTYTDASKLNALTNGSCSGAVLHFTPGTYYFEFTGSGGSLWTISDSSVDVVGGTAKGWTVGPWSNRPTIPSPGACKTEADAAPNSGVLLVWGSDSHLLVDQAHSVEFCATPSQTAQQVAIYGLNQTSNAVNSSYSASPTAQTSSMTGSNSAPFSPGLVAIDGTTVVGKTSGTSGSVKLKTFSFAAIPNNATITSVQLRIAHRETPSTSGAISSVKAYVAGTGASCTVTMTTRATLGTDSLYTIPCLTTLAQLSALTVQYKVTVASGKSATIELDGLQAVVNYSTAATKAQSGCVAQVSGGCAFITVVPQGGGNKSRFYIQGTVFAPLANMTLDFKNNTETQFTRGIILRSLIVSGIPPANITNLVTLPSASYADRTVELVVTVKGRRRARALVQFADGGGSTPGATVNVLHWSVAS